MDLTGWPFLVLVVGISGAVLVGTMALWNRWPHRAAWPLRFLSLVLVMVCGAAVMADVVNRDYGFYTSFGDLLGSSPLPHDRPVPARDRGTVERVRLDGGNSGIHRDGLVYLPAAYSRPDAADRHFPVVELFHGFPGQPDNWTRHLGIAHVLDLEISSGRLPPVIAVMPTISDHGRDSECVDAVRGRANETYLAVDVPTAVAARFRVADGPGTWAAMGYSTGGFCAVDLALHHPGRYAAAVSLDGYFTPQVDSNTGDLYRGRQDVRDNNSPQWLLAHGASRVPLYLMASRGDPEGLRAINHLRRAAPADYPFTLRTDLKGGHNFNPWHRAGPAALDWIGSHLGTAPPTSRPTG